jgi:hypothetical protein
MTIRNEDLLGSVCLLRSLAERFAESEHPDRARAVETLLSAHCYLAALASELVGDADLETAIAAAMDRCAERDAELARERDPFSRTR